MPVILFDIDGTLIRSGGAGKFAMEAAMKAAFNLDAVRDNVPYSGRTDQAIGGDLLRENGIPVTDATMKALRTAYLDALPRSLRDQGGTVCLGIPEILRELAPRPDVLLGLITGNVREGARIKLTHFGLWETFAVGGYGDVHTDRNDVARDALRQVHEHLGRRVPLEEVWVIGDTPLDVQCARAIGARAVAVATGWHAIEELHATDADHVMTDFANPAELLSVLL